MKTLDPHKKEKILEGMVIPAHPLALTQDRQLDEKRQRILTKYYMAAGAGGIAVGVHTTQFEIRDPAFNLYSKVLSLASNEVEKANSDQSLVRIAGVSGPTEQAIAEAKIASGLNYDLALISVNGLQHWSESELLKRAEKIAEEIPVFGFYLQPAVGGKYLSFDFWRNFADIPNVHAIKIAPFNRYQTLDVVRAVCHSSRCDQIALYTGNDDNIVVDLLTRYQIKSNGQYKEKSIVGGLLGHWAVWTKEAVAMFDHILKIRNGSEKITVELLEKANKITDANAVFFDAQNNFKGCISGIHEVLRRQGLMENILCLSPEEKLSPGQKEEIDRVYEDYPDLNDDHFVKENLTKWTNVT